MATIFQFVWFLPVVAESTPLPYTKKLTFFPQIHSHVKVLSNIQSNFSTLMKDNDSSFSPMFNSFILQS